MVNISQFFSTLYIALYIANSALKNHFMEGVKTSQRQIDFLAYHIFREEVVINKIMRYIKLPTRQRAKLEERRPNLKLSVKLRLQEGEATSLRTLRSSKQSRSMQSVRRD